MLACFHILSLSTMKLPMRMVSVFSQSCSVSREPSFKISERLIVRIRGQAGFSTFVLLISRCWRLPWLQDASWLIELKLWRGRGDVDAAASAQTGSTTSQCFRRQGGCGTAAAARFGSDQPGKSDGEAASIEDWRTVASMSSSLGIFRQVEGGGSFSNAKSAVGVLRCNKDSRNTGTWRLACGTVDSSGFFGKVS